MNTLGKKAAKTDFGDDSPQAEALEAQKMINEGYGWRMEGSVGRALMASLDDGTCMLGIKATSDTYGNRIPARHEVQEGTKGSRSNVVKNMGEEWARMLETLDAQPAPEAEPRARARP